MPYERKTQINFLLSDFLWDRQSDILLNGEIGTAVSGGRGDSKGGGVTLRNCFDICSQNIISLILYF